MLTSTQFNDWIEALESGKYTQGKYTLRDANDNFCCLGVLADITGAEWEYDPEDQRHSARMEYKGTVQVKNSYVHYDLISACEQSDLSIMNDNGSSFVDIVAYLKEHKNAFVGTD